MPDHSVVHRYARCVSYPEWGVGSVTGVYFTGEGEDVQQFARVQFQIGIRTVAPRDCGIAIIDSYQAQELGPAGVAAAIRARVGQGPSYLTFDIDGLDPAFAPGTGTPVAGGLSSAFALQTLWALRDVPFSGMDVVEVSPPYDHADITAIAAATIMQHHLQALALRRRG